ncbi:holo-ACP synthase [Sedimentisphaera salicampi]|uniref:Holo-[acyl-carrier-protein] synthase n=1 Tax=Sedimentisphaera salicampi TaxID=1941349 RepID=A0A1W6LLJ2_9BACT|nr:holo-ACP synthase [Sedimentisphaera salicampi]ARN56641.1 Holo-[acyl-carrier-protein] synthase [Sedimentisphaera salicampi]
MIKLLNGIDLVEISRIKDMLEKHGEHFRRRVFTETEIKLAGDNRKTPEKLAGRFAAKEAVFKLLGTGLRGGMSWKDVETDADSLGRPVVNLYGQTAVRADQMRLTSISLSISHTSQIAAAYAVAGIEI